MRVIKILPLWALLPTLLLAVDPEALADLVRVRNTTLRFGPAPPVFGYVTTNAFGSVFFDEPLAIATPAGETGRVFIAEQRGRVVVITNLAAPTRTVFLDISTRIVGGSPTDERGLLGLAFHPGYATNRYFYAYYSLNTNTAAGTGLHQRLSRFEASPSNPNLSLAASEVPLLTMYDEAGNHNGGDIHFGPDGFLYLSLGDEGGSNDALNNSQVIDKDFWAGIIRIDVDNRPESLAPNAHPAIHAGTYRIPRDNPFVGATNFNGLPVDPAKVRTEFYAVGLRNPWRMSFDPVTGILYCGDVGQGAREEIDVIRSGGNYGWAYREGMLPGPKTPPPGFTSINPILDYGRGSGTNQGTSVTGGRVYRGTRIPGLYGYYLFADYVSGNIWATRYDGVSATPFQRIAGDGGIAGFGVDPSNGDILLADQSEDTIKRLIYTPVSGTPLPATLAETGAFADLAALTPQPGIVPYEVNVPSWSDGARMTRWFSIPDLNARMMFRAALPWSFPSNTVWIQHLELEMTNGVPASRRRLETRFLITAATTYGVTYRWDATQTNAVLVPPEGFDETLTLDDRGTIRSQVWHYPGRSECLSCHNAAVNHAIGFGTPQLNRAFDAGGGYTNQIRAFAGAGYFSNVPADYHSLRALAAPDDETQSVEQRVRSHLAVNCAQCHRSGSFDARLFTPLSATRLIGGTPNDDLGNPANRLVQPGAPDQSVLLTRLSSSGPLRMPPLASTELDAQTIQLVSRWITNELPSYQTLSNWQVGFWGATNVPAAQPDADPDGDLGVNWLEYLTGTGPTNAMDFWSIGIQPAGAQMQITYPRLANRGFEVQWATNLQAASQWRFLDVPENRPFFAVTNAEARVPIAAPGATQRYYRVRVYEP